MNLREIRKLRQRVRGALTTVREATDPDAGHSDFRYYRRITGAGPRDLLDATHDELVKRAFDYLDLNPLAKRYVDLIGEWIVSEELRPRAEDELIDSIVQEHWDDPRNDWANMLPRYLEVMLAAGELFLPAQVLPDGAVVYDYFDPADISDVKLAEHSNRELAELTFVDSKSAKHEFPIIRSVAEPGDTFGRLMGRDPKQEAEDNVHGVIAFRWNCRPNSLRGRGDFFSAIDLWAALDDFHVAEMEKAQLLSRLIGDVTLVGGDDKAIQAWQERHGSSPQYASIPVHNDMEKWNLGAPPTGAADAAERERMHRRYASACTGVSPTVLAGDMESGTRAVAVAANDPMYMRGKRKQDTLVSVIVKVCKYQVDTRYVLNPSAFSKVEDWTITVKAPKLLRRDPTEGVAIVSQVVQSLVMAQQQHYIDEVTARRIFLDSLQEIGAEVDRDEVEAAIAAEAILTRHQPVPPQFVPDDEPEPVEA